MNTFQIFARIRAKDGRDLEYARHSVEAKTEAEAIIEARRELAKNPERSVVYLSRVECWDHGAMSNTEIEAPPKFWDSTTQELEGRMAEGITHGAAFHILGPMASELERRRTL